MADALTLPVSLYGTPIGTLAGTTSGALFTWSRDAESRWGLGSPVLSQSLRVGDSSIPATEAYFGALLPEGQWLAVLARDVQASSSDLVGLLHRVGADLAGALSVGEGRLREEPQTLDDEALRLVLDSASGFLLGGGGSALPGYQRKVTLTRRAGRWLRGNGTLPSTHILKPVSAEYRAAAEAENYLLAIARHLGLAPFDSWVEQIAGRPVLVVERYDRVVVGQTQERLHQEDAGQALGLPWGGAEKFESVDARANLAAVAGLLDRDRTVFAVGESDRERLLRYVTLNVAGGNSDAHAKNFSLLHTDTGKVSLAPFYDAAPLALAYDGSTSLAMRIAGRIQLPDVTRDDLIAEASSWGIPLSTARSVVDDTLQRIIQATRELTAHELIASHVPGYVRGQAQNLLDGKPARIPSAVPLMSLPYLGTAQPR